MPRLLRAGGSSDMRSFKYALLLALAAAGLLAGSAPDADALRADQRAWLKTRDDCGDLIHGDPPIYVDVFACLREQMTARVAKLRAIVAAKQFSK